MGSMIIQKNKEMGFTEFWDDGTQDMIDEWLEKQFGKKAINLDNQNQCILIYNKIISNKSLYNKGFNIVKKVHYLLSEPKREMTDREFLYHLNFGLGSPYNSDNLPYPKFIPQPKKKTSHVSAWHSVLYKIRNR